MAVSISPSATSSSLKTLAPLPTKPLSLSAAAKPGSLSISAVVPLRAVLVCVPFSLEFRCVSEPSRFARRVAVSSEYDQDEEILGGDEGEEPSFSPELKLFVGNLPFSVESAQLAGLFQSAGDVEMVEVIYDETTGRSRGFGFVTMSTIGEVEAAAQRFHGYELEGRALRVKKPPPPRRKDSLPRGGAAAAAAVYTEHQVYVGNLPWSVDNSVLEDFFSQHGNVLKAKVVYDRESGRSRGFGFVTYDTADEVNNAIEFLNGVEMEGRKIQVIHALPMPKPSHDIQIEG